ncbi:MAG TPA: DUF1993 domain-containing protein [Azospirillaceae bacterium]|nr:DUF1993 domain-containing protein [Azospirillaceae bacterium]
MIDELLLPTFTQMLRALSGWLDKADAHAASRGEDGNGVMALRLAPDMFPLSSQVAFACFQAREGVHRLRGEAVPEEALRQRNAGAEAVPMTLAEAKARIAETIAALAAPGAAGGAGDMPVALDLPNGMVFDMTGHTYVRDWLLPQFYFHLVVAYSILRANGVALGKADLVPHMFAYLRPGTAPAG